MIWSRSQCVHSADSPSRHAIHQVRPDRWDFRVIIPIRVSAADSFPWLDGHPKRSIRITIDEDIISEFMKFRKRSETLLSDIEYVVIRRQMIRILSRRARPQTASHSTACPPPDFSGRTMGPRKR